MPAHGAQACPPRGDRGDRRAVECLRQAVDRGGALWGVSITRTEILAGARGGEEGAILALLDRLRWIDVTTDHADEGGNLARTYLRSHPGIDTVDYTIAAAARKLDARLLTLIVRHFPMFPGLPSAYEPIAPG